MKDTRHRIINAARALFEEKGFAAATTRQIAKLAGVSEVTLFRHFETKRALFEETVHSCLHPYDIELYLESGVTYDLRKDLTHIAYDAKKTFLRNASLLRMVMRDKVRDSGPEITIRKKEHSAKNKLLSYFRAMHQAGHMQEDPNLALEFFVSNVNGFLIRGVLFGGMHKTDEAYFDWMLDKVITILSGGYKK